MLTFGGCTSAADDHALLGKKALEACDVRGANKAFADAFDADTSKGEYALAFVLTDLLVLVDDPALQRLFPRLGFVGPVDGAILWGKDGILARLSAKSSECDTLFATLPHPSAKRSGPDLIGTLDPALTFGNVREELAALVPRFQKLADAAHVAGAFIAAKSESERFVKLEGGCGVGSTDVQAPEMLALAAGLEAIIGAVRAGKAYDGNIPVKVSLQTSGDPAKKAWIEAMNAHLLHKTTNEGLDEARRHLTKSARYMSEAVAAARTTGAPTAPAFDWKKLPAFFLEDMGTFAKASQDALASDSFVTVPTVAPALQVNVWSFFARPVDLKGKTPVPWSLVVNTTTTPPFSSIKVDTTTLEAEIAPRFQPNIFAAGASFTSTLEGRWKPLDDGAAFRATFDPNGRFSAGYRCQ